MQSTALLTILRVFLVVLGALSVVWGIYDMFGEGQQGLGNKSSKFRRSSSRHKRMFNAGYYHTVEVGS
mgnify:CR=1 FL=1